MKRNQFLKSLLASSAALSLGKLASAESKPSMTQVGFEHLPVKEEKTMKTTIYRAETRGHANHGWLDTHHTFSFASYMNPERMHFGALRVLNDDIIAGGTGFGNHPHENMEIVSIPLSGGLEHKDSTGRHKVINHGDVQVMSAGKGIYHSESNHKKSENTNFLQIWVFPKKRDIEPRYDQKLFKLEDRTNSWQTVVAPDQEDALFINQEAWFSLARLEADRTLTYHKNNVESGLYLFVIEGEIKLGDTVLKKRDGAGIENELQLSLQATKDADLLLMEVPMTY